MKADYLWLHARDLPAVTERREGVLIFRPLSVRPFPVKRLSFVIEPAGPAEWILDLKGSVFRRRIDANLYAHVQTRRHRQTGTALGRYVRFACPNIVDGCLCDRDVMTIYLYAGEAHFSCRKCERCSSMEGMTFYPQWPTSVGTSIGEVIEHAKTQTNHPSRRPRSVDIAATNTHNSGTFQRLSVPTLD